MKRKNNGKSTLKNKKVATTSTERPIDLSNTNGHEMSPTKPDHIPPGPDALLGSPSEVEHPRANEDSEQYERESLEQSLQEVAYLGRLSGSEETEPSDGLNHNGVLHRPATDEEINGTFLDPGEDVTTLNGTHGSEEGSPLLMEDGEEPISQHEDIPLLESPMPERPDDDTPQFNLDLPRHDETPETPSPIAGVVRISEGQSIDEVVNAILQRPHTACRVPLDLIDFYPRNRKLFNQEALNELAANIAQVDVINDIILRIIPNGRYELVAGERRVRASRIAGKPDIPAKIYEMTDAEARQVRISENGHREDYHAMEEALAIGEMKEDFPTIELIAARLGKPVAYVQGRIKLISLVPDAQDIFLADAIGIRDAQELAAFEEDVQQAFIATHLSGWKKGKKFPDLKWEFDKLKCSLKNPPFDMKDPDLAPEMGICARCPFNSGCQQSLFAELAEDPVCRKASCYQLKTDKQLVKNITHAVAKHKPMAILSVMPFSDQQKTLIKEIPGTEGLEFILEQTVFEVKKPQPPKQDHFKDTSGKPNKKAFEEQNIHYKEALTYQENAIKNRKIFRSILIQRNGKVEGYMFTRDSKATSTGQSGKVGLIQDDIKAGTVTTRQLMDELGRIRNNEESSAKKDAAEVAENVHAALSVRLEAKDTPITHTPIDTAIQRWILFERLHYSDQREIAEKLFGENWQKLTPDSYIKALQDLTEDQVAILSRMVFLSINDTKKAATTGGYLSMQLAGTIGIDVSAIRQDRAQKSEERQKKFKKNENDLLKRIKQKNKKNIGKPAKKAEVQE